MVIQVGFESWLGSTQGPSWGYLKVNCSETLSTFGDKRPRNGPKNEEMAPRTRTGYPHIGLCVVSMRGTPRASGFEHGFSILVVLIERGQITCTGEFGAHRAALGGKGLLEQGEEGPPPKTLHTKPETLYPEPNPQPP